VAHVTAVSLSPAHTFSKRPAAAIRLVAAEIEITGLRNPCVQLDGFQRGLMEAVLDHDGEGNLIRKSGVMAIVISAGEVRAGDPIEVELPARPHRPLEVV
jgi:MOSC domain-containing protein YiiM